MYIEGTPSWQEAALTILVWLAIVAAIAALCYWANKE
jgi:hypothetical protein